MPCKLYHSSAITLKGIDMRVICLVLGIGTVIVIPPAAYYSMDKWFYAEPFLKLLVFKMMDKCLQGINHPADPIFVKKVWKSLPNIKVTFFIGFGPIPRLVRNLKLICLSVLSLPSGR